jgi:hypothetical protein
MKYYIPLLNKHTSYHLQINVKVLQVQLCCCYRTSIYNSKTCHNHNHNYKTCHNYNHTPS